MKKNHLLIAMAMIAALTIVSCKNKKPDIQTQNQIQLQKIEYGEETLAVIDSLANAFAQSLGQNPSPLDVVLTEKEKLVKPDFLYDPKGIDTLIRREQKICALAMLEVDRTVRLAYEMPTEETDEAIAKLLADINFNFSPDDITIDSKSASQNITNIYQACKESGDLAAFWTFNAQAINEAEYIIAQNPELYLGKISIDTWHTYNKLWDLYVDASRELGKFDPEMEKLNELLHRDCVRIEGYTNEVYNEFETVIPFYHIAKDQFEFRRNNMLTY